MPISKIKGSAIEDDAITSARLDDGTIVAVDLASDAVTTAKIQDSAVTLDKLSATGTKDATTFLRGDNTFAVVDTDLSADTTPQLGGDLDTNGNNISFGDSATPGTDDTLTFGASNDLQIYHDGSNSEIKDSGTGNFYLLGDNVVGILDSTSSEWKLKATTNGSVDLYYDNSLKLATTNTGIDVTGDITQSANANFRYEELPNITTSSSGWLTIFDLTIPSSGVWEITANPRLRYGSNNGFIACALFDTSDNIITQLSMLTERHTVNSFGNLGAYASWVVDFGTDQTYDYSIRFRIYFQSSDSYNANYNDSNGRPCITARKIRETTNTGVSEDRSY